LTRIKRALFEKWTVTFQTEKWKENNEQKKNERKFLTAKF